MLRLVPLVSVLGCGRLGFQERGVVRDASSDAGPGDGLGDAAPTRVQNAQTSGVSYGVGPRALALAAPSTPGTLLVIAFGANDLSSLGLPSGWMIAARATTNGACAVAIAYLPDNPGGIASVMFTQPSAQPTVAQLTEWTGVAASTPLDAIGTTNGASSITQSVVTTTATSATYELAVDVFCEDVNMPTYTPGAGWLNLGTTSNPSAEPSFTSEYQLVPTQGLAGETVTSSFSAKHAAAIAAFRPQ